MAKRTAAKRTTKKTAKRTTKRTAKKAPAKRASKKVTRKTTAKKTATRTTPAAKAPTRVTGAKGKARTKSEVYSTLAEHAGISKKEVAAVFETMHTMIAADLKKGNVGFFNIPGLMKVTCQRKPATRARKGINPFTGEEAMFKAKPARNVVKIRALKALKDSV